jgi:AcrR family transcriptional regulator
VGTGDTGAERDLLIAAIAKAASERGYKDMTVAQVLHNAGVPRATFEAHFESKEQALVAAQDSFLDRLWLEVRGACHGPVEWPLKVRAALAAVLAFLAEASPLARVFAVEASAASLAAAERQFTAFDQFASLLSVGRRHYPQKEALPLVTERALVGGVASIVYGDLLAEEPQALIEREPELVELLLMPYLGQDEARRIALG